MATRSDAERYHKLKGFLLLELAMEYFEKSSEPRVEVEQSKNSEDLQGHPLHSIEIYEK